MNRPEDAPNPATHPAATEGITLPPLSKRDHAMDATVRFTAGGSPIPPVPQVRQPGAGTIVFNRYRLLHVLGRGGMGVVWLAEDTKLSRTVALKFLPDIIGTDPVALAELKDETKRGLELAHPNIVRIYDFVDDDEAAAISMEFVNGKTLAEMRLTKPQKVFSAAEISPWIREMCDALDYAHTQCQLVHRDLKPANLMVGHDSHVKITDFGIARSMTETMTRISFAHGTTSGTMLYMSPQQAMGDRPCPTDDVYSLGATLYELLTGKPPFFRGDIAAQVSSKKAPTVRDRRAELNITAPDVVPEDWEAAISACLEKDSAFRPQSAGELAARLGLASRTESRVHIMTQRSLESAPTVAAASIPKEEPARPSRRRRLLLSAAAALVCLPLAALWWADRPGEWSVQTYPPGAFVSLGEVTQVAPAKFDDLSPGRHQATITLEGYEPRQIEFKVKAGQKVNIGVIRLSQAVGNIPLSNDDGDDFEITAVTTSVVPPQPTVGDPPNGSWNLDEIFLHSEYGNFSSNGRHYILREAQRQLRGRGHFKGELNGDTGTALHKAIQSFQMLGQLKPTGLLDAATLQALGLTSLPDKADWITGADEAEDEGWWAKHVSAPLRRIFE